MRTTTSQRATSPSVEQIMPSQEEITARAYDVYLERGASDGHALQDWLQAEQELLDLHSRVASLVSSEA